MVETAVASVMVRDPVVVAPHTGFKEILELLAERILSAVPVVSATGLVIGTVSEVDLLRSRRGHRTRGAQRLTAVELMTSPAVTVAADTTLAEATRLLVDSTARPVCVVDDGRLVGMLSPRAVLSGFRRPDKEILAEIEHEVIEARGSAMAHSLRVSVDGGVVQLTGRLARRDDAAPIVGRIAEIPGVIEVTERTR